jgi:general stress protein YciG
MPNNNPHGHNQYTKRDQASKPTGAGERGEHAEGQPSDESQTGGGASKTGGTSGASTPSSGAAAPSGTSRRGFASMDEATQREIASKGGHSQGRENNPGNFANDREKAREAGRKGGEAHGANRQ